MNKYLFQALTKSEEESGHSGYETTVYDDNLADATERAVHYFNDPSRKVSLVASAITFFEESPDPAEEGAIHWSVVVNGTEQANGVAFTQAAAEKFADDYLMYEVDL